MRRRTRCGKSDKHRAEQSLSGRREMLQPLKTAFSGDADLRHPRQPTLSGPG